MRKLTFQRRLPQRYALTGLKSRTPLEHTYSDPGRKPIPPLSGMRRGLSGMADSAMTPADLGPGGEIGQATPSDPNDLIGNLIGGRIAGKLGKRGMKGLTTTGIMGLLANAPLSAFPSALAQALASGMFTPAQLVNTLIGATITGQAAHRGQAALQGHGLPADLQNQTIAGIVQGLPITATGHFMDMARGKTGPSQFAEEVTDLTLANAPLGYVSNEALAEQSMSLQQGMDLANAMAGGPAATAGAPGGNVGAGAGPGPATGMGSPGEGEGGGGTVLCTVLYQKGLMPEEMYLKDSEYGRNLPQDVMDGYHVWAIPLAGCMTKSELLTRVMTPFVKSWGKHIAGEPTFWGKVCEVVGIPLCGLISKSQRLLKVLSATMRLKPCHRDLA